MRRPALFVWIALFICPLGFVSALKGEAVHSLYAICGAYPPELDALKKVFEVTKENGFTLTKVEGVEYWRGTYKGKDLILFRTGVSLVNAAYQLQFALDHFPITHVLFAGVAGGIDPSLHVGDVVIPERWAYHSEAAYLNEDGKGGYVLPDYLKAEYPNFGMIFPADVHVTLDGELQKMPTFPMDAALLATAQRAVDHFSAPKKAGRTVTVSVGGTGVAGTVFLDNAHYREWVFKIWKARCLDMESTALAQVAYANHKPVLIVRGLSDLAGGQAGKNPIDSNEASVAEIAANVLRAVISESK